MIKLLQRVLLALKTNKKGQGMVEYALIIGLIAVALIGVLGLLSTQIGEIFESVRAALAGV